MVILIKSFVFDLNHEQLGLTVYGTEVTRYRAGPRCSLIFIGLPTWNLVYVRGREQASRCRDIARECKCTAPHIATCTLGLP